MNPCRITTAMQPPAHSYLFLYLSEANLILTSSFFAQTLIPKNISLFLFLCCSLFEAVDQKESLHHCHLDRGCHNWIRSQIRWWLLSSMPSSATLPRLIRKHILMGSLSVPLLASMLAAESPVMWAEEGTGRGGWGGTAVVMVGMVGWWATRCYTSLFLFFSPFRRFFSSSM